MKLLKITSILAGMMFSASAIAGTAHNAGIYIIDTVTMNQIQELSFGDVLVPSPGESGSISVDYNGNRSHTGNLTLSGNSHQRGETEVSSSGTCNLTNVQTYNNGGWPMVDVCFENFQVTSNKSPTFAPTDLGEFIYATNGGGYVDTNGQNENECGFIYPNVCGDTGTLDVMWLGATLSNIDSTKAAGTHSFSYELHLFYQ